MCLQLPHLYREKKKKKINKKSTQENGNGRK
uniref:Uncharacterized protein n=1 Tax=Rhizophora mucronata TaxID=61149 RepID=A0A2P2K2V4_RHIMU